MSPGKTIDTQHLPHLYESSFCAAMQVDFYLSSSFQQELSKVVKRCVLLKENPLNAKAIVNTVRRDKCSIITENDVLTHVKVDEGAEIITVIPLSHTTCSLHRRLIDLFICSLTDEKTSSSDVIFRFSPILRDIEIAGGSLDKWQTNYAFIFFFTVSMR